LRVFFVLDFLDLQQHCRDVVSMQRIVVVIMVFICCELLYVCVCVSASNAVIDATKAIICATQPVFQLSSNAWWTSSVSGSSTATELRVRATVAV